MFSKPTFAPIFLLFFLSQASELKAMLQDEAYDYNHKHCIMQKPTLSKNKVSALKTDNLLFDFRGAPEEILKEIFNYLTSNDLLPLRETSKELKEIVDRGYWKNHFININSKSSSPAIQDVKDIPCSVVSLSFNKWKEKDMEQLLSFKHVTHLRLAGLNSWNFSTAELFNPYPLSSYVSCVFSIVNMVLGMELGTPIIFSNVTSLDLSNSSIGDYGIISFVSHFKKLQTLNMSNNDIGRNSIGEANAIANLNTLTSLNISKNHFSSETVKAMAQLTNLTSLDISYNFIDHNMIKRLSLLPKLTDFMHSNQRQKRNSNNCLFPFFYHPLQWRGGKPR